MTPMIQIRRLVKRYEGAVGRNAVNGISLEVATGELITLLGPSGCGKTTTLRMIAGLEDPTGGEILFDGQLVYSDLRGVNVPVNKRPIGMVFQSYAIWPHMNVLENVAFPLKVRRDQRLSAKDIRARAAAALEAVGLGEFLSRASTDLSGGQQQRVALARALVKEPKILLLDEPLSNLDAKLREQMREEIRDVQQRTGITTVFVTHDQNEALAMSDRVLVMRDGDVVESGPPRQVYQQPAHEFTAHFIGVANVLEGEAIAFAEGCWDVATALGTLRCRSDEPIQIGQNVVAFARPEYFALSRAASSDPAWRGTVERSFYQGDFVDYFVNVAGRSLRVRLHDARETFERGDSVHVQPSSERITIRGSRIGG